MATTVIDPRTFEHPYVSVPQLCVLFQVKAYGLQKHLASIGLEPARSPNGELFTTRAASAFYAASDVLLALPKATQKVFLAWQRGDVLLPPNPSPNGADAPPPLAAIKSAPVGPRGGRPF
jgi:hypothetical protein